MAKILQGKVVSANMQKTIVVEVTRKIAHPMYRKLMKRSKKFLVDSGSKQYAIGDTVSIVGMKPMAKKKFFRVMEEKQ
ncbi:MAG TPA: 30S ribosomal protein S17 [Patescibacteria group bacterium]|nr:30S ribosomal protein S17 [Patescibacteria group bacterium]